MAGETNETSCSTKIFVTLGRNYSKIEQKRDLCTFVYVLVGCCREQLVSSTGVSEV